MAEYDAFGRRKGENPLEQIEAAPAPAPAALPSARAGSTSRVFLVMVGGAALVAMAAIALAAVLLATTGDEPSAGSSVTDEPAAPASDTAFPDGHETPPSPGRSEPAAKAQGLEPGSLLTQPALARALAALRVTEYGRPLNVRVQSDRLDARLVTRKGLMRAVQVGQDGVPHEQHAWQGGAIPAMPWSAVDPAAPERLIRAATEREGRSAADVNYLVLMPLPDPIWGLFFRDGMHYQGDAAGKILRRVSP